MKYLAICFFFFFFNNVNGQRQAFIDELSRETCNCIEESDVEEDTEMVMGLCAVQVGTERAEEVKKTLGIDLTDTNQFEKFGEILAVSLIENCPVLMDRMLRESEFENAEEPENWSDMESAQINDQPDFGGPENKAFITTEIENTNSSGILRPTIKGKIREINEGLSNKITIRTSAGDTEVLYLTAPVPNRDELVKGKELTFEYRSRRLYNAATGRTELLKVITMIEK